MPQSAGQQKKVTGWDSTAQVQHQFKLRRLRQHMTKCRYHAYPEGLWCSGHRHWL